MVSSEVVFFPIRPTDSYSSFNWSAMVVPIFSGAIKKSMPWLRFWISFKHLNARSREIGFAPFRTAWRSVFFRSEEHTSELQSRGHLVCRLLLEKKKNVLLVRV